MAKDAQLGQTGRLGEELAVKYLKDQGYDVVDTNVTYKWGEIDIVAVKSDIYHFVEVKSANEASKLYLTLAERVGQNKLNRIKKSVQTYVAEHDLYQHELQIDLVMVKLNTDTKQARIKMIHNLH